MTLPLRRPTDTETVLAAPSVTPHPDAVRQACWILYVGFIAAPIIAGADKFFHLLVNWDQYLAPAIAGQLPVTPHTFMLAVGVIEVVAGLLVALKPSIGGLIVAAWLWGIIVNLLLIPGYFDVALRDFGLSLGALALARLSRAFELE
ncbi:MAG TPA: hypothetical protein VGR82_18530 [Methylomirabilota bacterium]|jgi:hypothetical protein|nr:hypothetical protein [Methylomirabilota bacterium]